MVKSINTECVTPTQPGTDPFCIEPSDHAPRKLVKVLDQLKTLVDKPPQLADGTSDLAFLRKAVALTLQHSHRVLGFRPRGVLGFLLEGRLEALYSDRRYRSVSSDGRTPNVLFDLDQDGALDHTDAFPMNPQYDSDRDADAVPDQIDLFPDDATRFLHPNDVGQVRFDVDGTPILQQQITLQAGKGVTPSAMETAVARWNKTASAVIRKQRSDTSFGWEIAFSILTTATKAQADVTVDGHYFRAKQTQWPVTEQTDVIIHECGHHLGLEDRYLEAGKGDDIYTVLQKQFLVRKDAAQHSDFMKEPYHGIIFADDIKIVMAEAARWPRRLAEAQRVINKTFADFEPVSRHEVTDAMNSLLAVLRMNPGHSEAQQLAREFSTLGVRLLNTLRSEIDTSIKSWDNAAAFFNRLNNAQQNFSLNPDHAATCQQQYDLMVQTLTERLPAYRTMLRTALQNSPVVVDYPHGSLQIRIVNITEDAQGTAWRIDYELVKQRREVWEDFTPLSSAQRKTLSVQIPLPTLTMTEENFRTELAYRMSAQGARPREWLGAVAYGIGIDMLTEGSGLSRFSHRLTVGARYAPFLSPHLVVDLAAATLFDDRFAVSATVGWKPLTDFTLYSGIALTSDVAFFNPIANAFMLGSRYHFGKGLSLNAVIRPNFALPRFEISGDSPFHVGVDVDWEF